MTVNQESTLTLTSPADRKKAHQFTSDNARAMQKRGSVQRSINASVRKYQRLQPLDDTGKPKPLSIRQIAVAEEIEHARKQLREEIAPNERANLLRALDLLLDRERVLAGIPSPGSFKPGPLSSRPAPPQFPPPTLVKTPEPPDLPPTEITDNHKAG